MPGQKRKTPLGDDEFTAGPPRVRSFAGPSQISHSDAMQELSLYSSNASKVLGKLKRDLAEVIYNELEFPGQFYSIFEFEMPDPGLSVLGRNIRFPLNKLSDDLIRSAATPLAGGSSCGQLCWVGTNNMAVCNTDFIEKLNGPVLDVLWGRMMPKAPRPRLVLDTLQLCDNTMLSHEWSCSPRPGHSTRQTVASIYIVLPEPWSPVDKDLEIRCRGATETFSISDASRARKCSIFAFYNGVTVAPGNVSTGRRVMLSYLLVLDDPSPRPFCDFPLIDSKIDRFKGLLLRWDRLLSLPMDNNPVPQYLFYLLDTVQDAEAVGHFDNLRGSDREKFLSLARASSEAGFGIGVVTLWRRICGRKPEPRYDLRGKPALIENWECSVRFTSTSSDYEGLSMDWVNDLENSTASHILQGPPMNLTKPYYKVDDEKEIPGHIQYFYNEPAIIIYLKSKSHPQPPIANGVDDKQDTCDDLVYDALEDAEIVNHLYDICRRSDNGPPKPYEELLMHEASGRLRHNFNGGIQRYLTQLALKREKYDLWKFTSICSASDDEMGSLQTAFENIHLQAAWRKFSERKIRFVFEQLCKRHGLQGCLDFLNANPDRDEKNYNVPQKVLHVLLRDILPMIKDLDPSCALAFFSFARARGEPHFLQEILTRLVDVTRAPKNPRFWLVFVEKASADYAEAQRDPINIPMTFGLHSIDRALAALTSCPALTFKYNGTLESTDGLSFLTPLIKYAAINPQSFLSHCRIVLDNMLDIPAYITPTADLFAEVYIKRIIPSVTALVQRYYDGRIDAPPFGDFFFVLIARYLRLVLGSGPYNPRPPTWQCARCAVLEEFIATPTLIEADFVGPPEARSCLFQHVKARADLVTYTLTSEDVRLVKKAVKGGEESGQRDWAEKRAQAEAFLSGLGSKTAVDRVLGRYRVCVDAALEGRYWFTAKSDALDRNLQSRDPIYATYKFVKDEDRWKIHRLY